MKSLVALLIALSAWAGFAPHTALAQQTVRTELFVGIIKCHSEQEQLEASIFVPISTINTDNGKLVLKSFIDPNISPLLLDAVEVDFGIKFTATVTVALDATTKWKIKLETRDEEINSHGDIPGILDLGGLDLGIVSPGTQKIPMVCNLLGVH